MNTMVNPATAAQSMLRAQGIELPSLAFGNSVTRFTVVGRLAGAQPGWGA